jgi:Flp pilus assembly protein TadB
MEWTEILNYIFGGTSLIGLATTLIFWSKSKRAKEAETVTAESNAQQSKSEAEQADIATQMQKIELGNKYMKDTLDMVELVKKSLDRSDGNQEKMMRKLDTLAEQNKKQDGILTDIVTYLNGDFQEFLQRTHKKGEQDNG